MDYQVNWSPEALDDIDEIASYIAKDSPFYAQSIVEQLQACSRQLSSLPLRGRIVPELKNQHYRKSFVHSYRMIYRIVEKDVEIIAVIHGARILTITDRISQ